MKNSSYKKGIGKRSKSPDDKLYLFILLSDMYITSMGKAGKSNQYLKTKNMKNYLPIPIVGFEIAIDFMSKEDFADAMYALFKVIYLKEDEKKIIKGISKSALNLYKKCYSQMTEKNK